jgi:hypothetical protein
VNDLLQSGKEPLRQAFVVFFFKIGTRVSSMGRGLGRRAKKRGLKLRARAQCEHVTVIMKAILFVWIQEHATGKWGRIIKSALEHAANIHRR